MTATPEHQWSNSFPVSSDLKEFLLSLQTAKVSEFTRMLFGSLASYPPPLRLAFNLKKFLGCTVLHEVTNILSEGLTDDERSALLELDQAGLSIRIREIAHGLLNVHERWTLYRKLSKMFREARVHKDEFEQLKPLDTILGG